MATSTLAAYVSYSDLGTPVISGLNTNNTVEAFAGALLVAASGRRGGPGSRRATAGAHSAAPASQHATRVGCVDARVASDFDPQGRTGCGMSPRTAKT